MVQKKKKTKAVPPVCEEKVEAVKSEAKTNLPVPVKTEKGPRQNNAVLSFILFVVACFIYFAVGYLFSDMAVREDFCRIRTRNKPKFVGEVVAVVENENIYMAEVKDYAASIPQLAEVPFEMVYPKLLERIINFRVLKAAASKAGTAQLPAVQKAIQLAEDEIVAQAYLDQQIKDRITDERLQEFYQEEVKNFKPVEEMRAHHILLRSEKEARDILVQLKAGADFGMLANKYSQDKSEPDGDLGYFSEVMMPPEFGRAAFALKVGQISEPVKTAFGWHIIQVDERRLSSPPPFEDVKEDLRQVLMEQEAEKVLSDERKKWDVRVRKPSIQ